MYIQFVHRMKLLFYLHCKIFTGIIWIEKLLILFFIIPAIAKN